MSISGSEFFASYSIGTRATMADGKRLKVLISGAGVAGPALAFWLHRLGHSCTVIERGDSLRTGGQQIDLRGPGIEAVKRMGILSDVRDCVVDEAGLGIVDGKNKAIAFFPRHAPGSETQSFSSEYEIMRGDLCEILYRKTKHTTMYRFGLHVDCYEDLGNNVKVEFSDGSVERYDLLVGADGQGSRIRRAMFEGDDEQSLRSMGCSLAYFPIDRTSKDMDHATAYWGTQQRVLMTRWHSPDRGQVYLMTFNHGNEIKSALKQDAAKQKMIFGKLFKDVGWERIDRLLGAMHSADDFYAHEIIQVRADKWSKGRVVLLGDAAFCSSPMSGMGTSLALVGAYVLAGAISENQDLGTAFQAYDNTLRPYVEKIQALRTPWHWILPKSEIGLRILNCALRFASKIGLFSLKTLFGQESGNDWKMPQYGALDED